MTVDPSYKYLLVITTNHPNKDLYLYNFDLRNSNAPKLVYSHNLTQLIKDKPEQEIPN